MIRLTPELREQVAAGIRAGGFPLVAAQAFGVSKRSFNRWRKLGRSNEGDDEFHAFAVEVDKAIGQARLRAEISIYTDQPRIWLQHGPGRETSDNPGWTVAVKPAARTRSAINAFAIPEVLQLIHVVVDSLDGQPEVQAKIADTISHLRNDR